MTTPAAAPAATASAAAAAQPYFDPVDTVNSPAGQPTQEIWPGAVDASQYGPGSGPQPPGGTGGPPYGSWSAAPFTQELPEQAPGGGYQDTAWQTGHDGPQAVWDSSAGAPFAPSGAPPAELHGEDTGAVYVREHVTPAGIGTLTRHTMTGQTTVREAPTQEAIGLMGPNDRADLDQQQWHDPDGHDPWDIPYAERGIQNNVAYEAQPISPEASPYTPAGQLPDRSVYDYAAVAYQPPPDPYMGNVTPASPAGIGGGWLAG